MMIDPKEKLQELFAAYHKALPAKLAEITNDWQQLRVNWSPTNVEAFIYKLHKLRGSAGTYGYTAISGILSKLEEYIKSLKITDPLKPIELATIDNLLNTLNANSLIAPVKLTTLPISDSLKTADKEEVLYLLEPDLEAMEDIITQLIYYGYQIKKFRQFADFQQALIQQRPTANIVNIQALTNSQLQELSSLTPHTQINSPIVFISDNNDMPTRLLAARANSSGFFLKPIDIDLLTNKLTQICGEQINEPYRILIVEDSESLSNYFSLVLQQAGMLVAVVNEPLTITATLQDFNPDLILMDLYMPNCSGLELAAILRQQESYTSIPIVFLSAEENKSKQLTAISLGGDDFLTKPIQAEHLISIVSSRVQRSRILRSYMVKDSLTGLFNHTTIQQLLETELLRSKRHDTSLSFVMIDIDHFKNVNDTYGHPAGDKVIQSLCNLLRNRLRKSDLIGRYGGEEFAVVLPNLDHTLALQLFNEIREKFSQLQHGSLNNTFYVSFSAGIATYPAYQDVDKILLSADKALYEAKQAGRNCVVLAK